jgi:hypothetical protein
MSDIVLNILSTKYGIVASLKPYFYKQSMIKTAFDAGITVVSALVLLMVLSYFSLGFAVPYNFSSLVKYCALAFVLGYFIDIYIYKAHIFGSRLNEYYKKLGAGFWGASAFVFSILISFFLLNKITSTIL